ncbi:uncharacterized protein BX664DRAFT_302506 [Halteromyces radiatus]|uniref:uncharacterized protein n=1 Tax=Halteromyces radiatus TaxID=101107 RepID=UPI00222110A9|nr:uncharacterized protein BX664DRAFT_302506 [Halteromyces radiatus]KAI8081653.1 hypothetical protein BX664DRAFT_302506 [Halteromyces radiatus]
MATERISQIIPFVKCSDCGANVSLRNLGTHICSNMPPIPALPILPQQKKERSNPTPTSSPYNTNNSYYNIDSPSSTSSLRNQYSDPVLDRYPPSPTKNTSSSRSDRYGSPTKNNYNHSEYDKRPSPKNATSGFGNTYKNGASGSLDSLMADLMDSMNEAIDQCTDPRPAPPANGCASCYETFNRHDDPLMYESKLYHERCFTCTVCRIPLDLRRAHEHQNNLYCQRDFALVKKKIHCASCDQAIESHQTPLKALGKYYHPGHIQCYQCQEPLDEKSSYREHQGRVYCRRDYRKMTLPKCRGCGKPVEKEAVSSKELQGKWHVSCFGCQTCHQSFPDSTFYVYDNSPYCRRHYHQLNNSLCRSCDEPIEGPCAQTSEGWRFHPPCFTCNVCDCALTDTYYMFEHRIYCEPHIMELQRRRKVRAEKRKTHFGQV